MLERLLFKIPFFKKYVDVFLTAVLENMTEVVLQAFNNLPSHHLGLKFTNERENPYRGVPFLDSMAMRDLDNKVIFDWYRKPTKSERLLHYNSYHPLKYKINLIKGMTHRIRTISYKNLHILLKILIGNG